jgi:hypothetical protein
MDRTLFQMKLTATTEQIALVERDLENVKEPDEALAGARENARRAARGLAEMENLFNGMDEPSQGTRACPACKKTIMASATRCGFCWTKIVLVASG